MENALSRCTKASSIVGKVLGRSDVAFVQAPSPQLEEAVLKMACIKKTAELITEMWDGANAELIMPQEARSFSNTTPTTLESFVSGVFRPAYIHSV